MRHSVYTRQYYRDRERFRERMALACRTCIPAMIEAQEHAEPVRWCWQAPRREADDLLRIVREAGWPGELEVVEGFGPGEDDIQSTLDSDDRIEPSFLRTVQRYHRPDEAEAPELVTWQPVKQRLADGALFRHRKRYSGVCPSMFYAIYRPSPAVRVYAQTHTLMNQLCPARLAPETGAIVVIHGRNALNNLTAADLPLEATR